MPSESATDSRASLAERLASASILAVVLTLSAALGFATPYVLALVTAISIVVLVVTRGVDWTPDSMSLGFAGAFLALAVIFAIAGDAPADAASAFNFTAFVLFWPLAVLLRRGAKFGNAHHVALLAIGGAGVALAVAVYQVFVLGTGRAGVWISDPIRLANTAVTLGFLAPAIGWAGLARARRWLLLVGPIAALAVVLLTGARVAMVAYLGLTLLTVWLLSPSKLMGTLIGLASILAAVVLGLVLGGERVALLIATLGDIIAGHPIIGDEAVRIRFALYHAGWQAFLDSPIIGHGWDDMMPTVTSHLGEADKSHGLLPHLHNEVLNFAVFSGVIGVVLYGVLLAAPLLVAFRSPRDTQYLARTRGATVLIAAYLLMGLTDTMVSFETHTALYVGFAAILLAYCRDPEPRPR